MEQPRERTHTQGIFHLHQLAEERVTDFDSIFLGDALVERWGRKGREYAGTSWELLEAMFGARVFNAGVSGDRARDVLYRLREQQLLCGFGGRLLRAAALLVGGADLARADGSPAELLACVREIVAHLREDSKYRMAHHCVRML